MTPENVADTVASTIDPETDDRTCVRSGKKLHMSLLRYLLETSLSQIIAGALLFARLIGHILILRFALAVLARLRAKEAAPPVDALDPASDPAA